MTGAWRAELRAAVGRLAAAGVESPAADVRLLAAHLAGCAPLEVGFLDAAPAGFAEALARRERREPLQHITGTAAFGPLDIAVGPGVFIPRPETEVLADWVVRRLRGVPAPRVVDLCTGSGALACYIAHEIDDAAVVAVELSPDAATWARRTVADNGLGGRVTVVEGDATDAGLLADMAGGVDAVVCNPPYVPAAGPVAPEVDADPDLAVYGGESGMDVIEKLLDPVARLLRPGRVFGIEHDDTTAAETAALVDATGRFTPAEHLCDLAGRERFVTAARL